MADLLRKRTILLLSMLWLFLLIIVILLLLHPSVDESWRNALNLGSISWLTTFLVIVTNSVYMMVAPLLIILCFGLVDLTTAVRSSAMVGLSQLLVELVKEAIKRPRPVLHEIVYQAHYTGYSFPSGHATMATVVSGLLYYLVRARLSASAKWRWRCGLVVYCLLVGWSRVYLGAHYPSDVLGGYLLGSMLICVIPVMVTSSKNSMVGRF